MPSLSGDPREAVGTGSSVLVFESPFDPLRRELCPALCGAQDADPPAVLAVLFTERPAAYARSWYEAAGRLPRRLRIVSVDPGSKPATAAADAYTVERVTSPGDLTSLGVAITEGLSSLTDGGDDVAVCIDSLTSLLQYVDVDRAGRFLHELSAYFDDVDAAVHAHLDPNAHDGETVDALVPLFDDVVDPAGTRAFREAD